MIRKGTALAVATAAALLGGCGDDSAPTEPDVGVRVAAVEVTSPIDTVLALSRTVQLSATARDDDGQAIADAELAWRSSDEDVATVSPTGRVSPVAPGRSTITAEAEERTGTIAMRVVGANLEGIGTLITDPFTLSLISHGSDPMAAALEDALEACSQGLTDGHVLMIDGCLRDATAELEGAAEANDRALGAVLAIVLAHGGRLLDL